jgi:hypothetical protein
VIATYWLNHPDKKWLGWVMGVLFIIIILLGTAGVLAGLGILPSPA